MNTSSIRTLLLLALLGIASLVATGCANTAHGISKDYHHAEDKVENAVK
jgi:predicted small secreted protein